MISKIKMIVASLITNLWKRPEIVFISEPAQWVIYEICKDMMDFLNTRAGKTIAGISFHSAFLRNTILHVGSIPALIANGVVRRIHSSNMVVLSWYHLLDDDPRIPFIPELNRLVSVVHTACTLTRDKLVAHGFDASKVVVIPEHIDTSVFFRYADDRRHFIRRTLGLPADKMIIGSFQKDGCGWGDGSEPKYEKGPDVFCDAIERVAVDIPIHVLLTGPARGYVKRRLDATGIGYTHAYLPRVNDLTLYYNALDLYVVASREEGGPKSILESWACGVPIVSTRVGMASDIVHHGENGLLVNRGDVGGLTDAIRMLHADAGLMHRLRQRGLDIVPKFDTQHIGQRFWNELYAPYIRKTKIL